MTVSLYKQRCVTLNVVIQVCYLLSRPYVTEVTTVIKSDPLLATSSDNGNDAQVLLVLTLLVLRLLCI
jgi:hypothetical protein